MTLEHKSPSVGVGGNDVRRVNRAGVLGRLPQEADREVIAALLDAGDMMRAAFSRPVSHGEKARYELVTEVDKQVDAVISARLKSRYPNRPVYSEESGGRHAAAGDRWILDPLDGTANFVFGVPHFGVSLSLEDTRGIAQAYAYNPIAEEFYYTHRGLGASLLNGRPIRVSQTVALSEAVVVMGFSANFPNIQRYHDEWPHLFQRSRKALGLLSPALNLCNVARGRIDAFIDFGSNMEGHAAGALIVANAGGVVANYDHSPWDHLSEGVIAWNGRLETFERSR